MSIFFSFMSLLINSIHVFKKFFIKVFLNKCIETDKFLDKMCSIFAQFLPTWRKMCVMYHQASV